VSNNAECSRRYGAAKTTKRLQGTVVGAIEVQKEGNSRLSWLITADYDLGGGDMKRTELNIRSVKIVEFAEIPPVAPAVLQIPLAIPIPIPPPVPPLTPLIDHPIALAPPIEPTPEEERFNDVLPQYVPPPLPFPQQSPEPATIAHQTPNLLFFLGREHIGLFVQIPTLHLLGLCRS
jgi:hypothetical protein